MTARKIRIETENAPPSTGFRSQGLIAGGIFFGAGQIGAEMPQPGVLREPTEDMADSVRITLNHLDQVTRAAGLDRNNVFEVAAFPKVTGSKAIIQQEVADYLGFEPLLFTYHEVFDVAMHAMIEMDWMAVADGLSKQEAAEIMKPLGKPSSSEAIKSGPFVMWNKLAGHGDDLGKASDALLTDLTARLNRVGSSPADLVKLTVYLQAFDPYPMFNEATKRHFAEIIPPARSVLVAPEITGDAKIVIDVVALQADTQ
ncbi:MAG: RidA family protein [Aggregatilineales bacterium]